MFEGKTVVVTGAAGALGQAVFSHFADRGAACVALDYSDELLRASFPDRQAPHEYLVVDLTSRESCRDVIADVLSRHGHVDVLCNVAGGFMMGETVHESTDKTWDFLMNLNAKSIIHTADAVVPSMLANGGGKIVNVAAGAALRGVGLMGIYTASKAAVMRLTESMSAELKEQKINVNCIMPSMIDTPRNREDMPDADYSKWVPPAQLANVIGFLASDDAVAIHGAAVPVDGLS